MLVIGMAMGFYSQEQAFHSIDFNTLGLLLGMMILVAMLGRTGAFEYLATLSAKWSGGNPWYLLLLLAGTTTFLSLPSSRLQEAIAAAVGSWTMRATSHPAISAA